MKFGLKSITPYSYEESVYKSFSKFAPRHCNFTTDAAISPSTPLSKHACTVLALPVIISLPLVIDGIVLSISSRAAITPLLRVSFAEQVLSPIV